MNIQENTSPKGTLSIKVFDKSGSLVETYEETNLIVGTGKQALATLLAAATNGKKVTKIGFGTDGTEPSSGNTSLTSPFVKDIDSYTNPDTSSVVFNWSLVTTEANGKAIQEFGLICFDNSLFARRTRAVINKTSDLRLEGTWKIQF